MRSPKTSTEYVIRLLYFGFLVSQQIKRMKDFGYFQRALNSHLTQQVGQTTNSLDYPLKISNDSRLEVPQLHDGQLKAMDSVWGHAAGVGLNRDDSVFIYAALRDLLTQDA